MDDTKRQPQTEQTEQPQESGLNVDQKQKPDEQTATSLPAEQTKPEEQSDSSLPQDLQPESKDSKATSTDSKPAASEPKEEKPEKKPKEKPESPSASSAAKWYIIHTYSGHENKVAKSLRQRVQSLGFEDRIFDIIVPVRNTIRVSQGKKETVKEKIFPGYVLVKMILTDESWILVRTTQGVTAFIGAGNKPTPISDKEVEAIQKFMDTEEPLYKTTFSVGEAVKIIDGPFTDFLGTIDDIDEAKGKLKVLVSIFGRETPVELDFLQVNKL